MTISPDKTEQPSTCCDADTEIELKVDSNGKYIAHESCSDCGDTLATDTNL